MPVEIANTTFAKDLEHIGSKAAQDTLTKLTDNFRGKPGVLKLMHTTDNSKNMTFERKGWWQVWARRRSKMKATAECLDTLFTKAYKDPIKNNKNLSETDRNNLLAQCDAMLDDFQKFLQENGNSLKSGKLVSVMEKFQSFVQCNKGVYAPEDIDVNNAEMIIEKMVSAPARMRFRALCKNFCDGNKRLNMEKRSDFLETLLTKAYRDPIANNKNLSETAKEILLTQCDAMLDDIKKFLKNNRNSLEGRELASVMEEFEGFVATHENVYPGVLGLDMTHSVRVVVPENQIANDPKEPGARVPKEGDKPKIKLIDNPPAAVPKVEERNQANRHKIALLDNSKLKDIKLIPNKLPVSKGKSMREALRELYVMEQEKSLGIGQSATVASVPLRDGNRRVVIKVFKSQYLSYNERTLLTKDLNRNEATVLHLKQGTPGVADTIAIVVQKGSDFLHIPLKDSKAAISYLESLAKSGEESGEEIRIAGFVMSLADGKPLDETKGVSDPEDRKIIAKKLFETLNITHRDGVIHRDIKPDAIILGNKTNDNKPKSVILVDFGSGAHIPKDDGNQGGITEYAGTRGYMHPNVSDRKAYGPEADVYSSAMTFLCNAFNSGLVQDLQIARYGAYYLNDYENPEFTTYRTSESKKNQSYLKSLLEFAFFEQSKIINAERDVDNITNPQMISDALKRLNRGDPEMRFIEEAFELSMKGRSADYLSGLEKLQKHPYLQ